MECAYAVDKYLLRRFGRTKAREFLNFPDREYDVKTKVCMSESENVTQRISCHMSESDNVTENMMLYI